ncbi:ATP-dependent DNA helicase RuvA [Campylobacter concisus]|uniref:ATP-dependent DNA helicase RuvA n=1 Tax=Campylobacter concisus TaxID=199 RepID=UPI0011E8150D|nr:ATP-dependent DNA helicase RuvA [Campylobacter concisus]
MNEQNLGYVANLKIDNVPWDRLSCSYGTAELFAKILKSLSQALKSSKFDENELDELLDEIVAQCEYQETFWHATPFALVFLVRIYKSALGEKGEAAKFISRKLEEFFKFMLEICEKLEHLEHAKPLAKMEQMLEPKYLDIVDQDELSYDDRLFYSFYYYSRIVLQGAFVKI